jgi:hypothetical protein
MNEPEKLRTIVRVNKQQAALSQLTAAIVIWFQGGDPVSIHTLAAAAHDCFYWMVKHMGKKSILREWMSPQSKRFQKRIAEAQKFFKHGHQWLKKRVKYPVLYGELLMFDSVICYGMIFGASMTPVVLRLYGVRFALENADILGRELSWFFIERDIVEELAPLSRQEFFKRCLSILRETTTPVWNWPFYSGSPSESP